jgi:hypothetical protein
MGEYFGQIPLSVKDHIKDITRTSGLPNNDDSLELMSEAWLGKMEAYDREIDSHDMEVVSTLDKDDDRGAIVMTYSGSLINIGPQVSGKRTVEYSSIGLRSDVPDTAEHNASILSKDVTVDQEVEFEEGPVSSSSAAFKIAVCPDNFSVEDQEEALSNATMVLSKEFADINKTLIMR